VATPEANLKLVPPLRVRYCPADSSTCYERDEEKCYCAYCERTYPESAEHLHSTYPRPSQSHAASAAVAICPNASCGRMILDDAARFCPGCGDSLANAERAGRRVEASIGAPMVTAEPQVATRRQPPQMAVILAAGIIFLIVLLILLESRPPKLVAPPTTSAAPRSIKQVPRTPQPRQVGPPPLPPAPKQKRVVKETAKKTETVADEHVTDTTATAPTPPMSETASESPQPRAREGDLISIEDVAVRPIPLSSLRVTCPQVAIRMRWTGTTQLQALISASGVVEDTRVLKESGKAILDGTAVAAMRMRRYTPAVKDGVSVKTWILVEVAFDCARR
jgi:TonB family protein